jgi:hypothetical protein
MSDAGPVLGLSEEGDGFLGQRQKPHRILSFPECPLKSQERPGDARFVLAFPGERQALLTQCDRLLDLLTIRFPIPMGTR